jgi:hypothetical protein
MNVVRYTSVLLLVVAFMYVFAFPMPFCCLFDALSLVHPDGEFELCVKIDARDTISVWISSPRERR